MTQSFYDRVAGELNDIDAQGLTKPERVIASRQGPVIQVAVCSAVSGTRIACASG